jgi:acetolactate synthase small subunit
MSYMDALPDFVKLAEAYGHVGMRIEKPADVGGAARGVLKLKDRLVFMDFITDQTENVYPDDPGGRGPDRNDPGVRAGAIMRHIIAILLENESGALSRVAGCSRRAATTSSRSPSRPPRIRRCRGMTLVTSGSDEIIEQITKQLNKLIDVVKVMDLTEHRHIERELMLVKVRAGGDARRGQAPDRHLPRPHHRRDRGHLRDRTDRQPTAQARRLSSRPSSDLDSGSGALRRHGHRPG